MSMTKKTYVAVAANLVNMPNTKEKREIVNNFVDTFAADNPHFKRIEFLRACGYFPCQIGECKTVSSNIEESKAHLLVHLNNT